MIKAIKAREILDSRANPTIEVDLKTEKGLFRASVPSGASTGKHEAWELRDNDKRYHGKGVQKAINNINKIIAPRLKNKEINQGKIDDILMLADGTPNKTKLGANAILAVSIAVCKAGGTPLYKHIGSLYGNKKFSIPQPSFNIINGGKHAGNKLTIQEYMIQPQNKKYSEQLRMGSEIYNNLKTILTKKYGKAAINVGDEGGFAPPINKIKEPLKLIMQAAKGYKIKIAIDAAANSFYKKGKYLVEGKLITADKLTKIYEEIINEYPITSIEDPYYEEDYDQFAKLNKKTKIQIIGDDLLVTNCERIQKAIHHEACNALLLKINQIGTITEALEAAKLAKSNGWTIMTSHRSGETTDTFIADLAVGIGAESIKAGAPCRGERTAKYNQLKRIEEEL